MCTVFRSQPSLVFVFLCVLFLSSNCATANEFTVAVLHSNGTPVLNGSSIIEHTELQFRCQFDTNPVNVHVDVLMESDNKWEPQVYCSNTTTLDTRATRHRPILQIANYSCTTERFQVNFEAPAYPIQLKCKINFIGLSEKEKVYVLRTYRAPFNFTLAVFRSNGAPVLNESNILENTELQLQSRFGGRPLSVQIDLLNGSNNTWLPEVYCVEETIIALGTDDILRRSNVTCALERFQVNFKAPRSSPILLRCKLAFTGRFSKEKNYTLRTHTVPSRPTVKQSPTFLPAKDSWVSFTCQSTARPPPKLRFQYNDKIVQDSVYKNPEPYYRGVDRPSATSTLIWTIRVSSELYRIELFCAVYDHPAYAKQLIGSYKVADGPSDPSRTWKPYDWAFIIFVIVLVPIVVGVVILIRLINRKNKRRVSSGRRETRQ